MPWRRAARRTTRASKYAHSSSTRVVLAEISLSPPPMTPANPTGPSPSQMTRSSVCSARSTPSSVTSFSPARARRTMILAPRTRSRSYAWSGCPLSSIRRFVTSTTVEIDRTPSAERRHLTASGDGPIDTPVTTAAPKCGHASPSSIVTVTKSATLLPWSVLPSGAATGEANGTPNSAAASRASPT